VGLMCMYWCIFPFETMSIQILGVFALNPKFLGIDDLFMQLMHDARPKSFHDDLRTRSLPPIDEN
jgi:hypothetical protein